MRDPFLCVSSDLAEASGGMTVLEVRHPAPEEQIQVLHDHLRMQRQPAPGSYLPDPVPGVLHRPIRGPAGEEVDASAPVQPRGADLTVVESEEVKAFPTHFQVHDPRFGHLRLQPQLPQQFNQSGQRPFGLAAGEAHHDQ
ncbi:hypothetical protein VXC91_46635, partial [Streptomyces chiangmaiensis]